MSKAIDYDEEKKKIIDFLRTFYQDLPDGTKNFVYSDQILSISRRDQVALFINLEDVHNEYPELADAIRQNTSRYHTLFCDAVDDIVHELIGDQDPPVKDALDAFIFQRLYMDRNKQIANVDGSVVTDVRKKYPPELMRRFEIYFQCRPLDKICSVREIKAELVGKLVKVRGVVIRSTEVKPLASVITYTCDTCGSETYQPVKGPAYTPAINCPSKDCVESKANGRLQMQVRGSKFDKFQEIRIQELSDQVPVGSIPRTMPVYVRGENTRHCLPGDTVTISGVLMPLIRSGFRQLTGGLVTDVYLDTHHIENNRNEDELNVFTELTDEEIEIVSRENFYDLLAYSIAPEIYGHVDVKKSLLLALVGGVDKNANGMKIRGAINIILMGDPGVAKSQLLSYVDRLAMRSQYTTGRGSSGVGLTAAVVKDQFTGEMTLEGGALVLADRGICCIDEFDKMMDGDRTAIHEVMEQQTISIAKAGILTSLNARVSILAAANPAFGRYNPKRSIEDNIQLPAALLSRFDLLWLIQDKPDRESDKKLAEHITYVHMKGHQPASTFEPLDMSLIRRYFAMCKRKQPTIPDRLKNLLIDTYVKLRKESRVSEDTTFTSPRNLLAVIRMSTALARLRLVDEVEKGDIDEAIRLMEASKQSLRPQQQTSYRPKDSMDHAFDIIRELFIEMKENEPGLELRKIINKCNQRGLDDDIVHKCVDHYTNLGLFMMDKHNRIHYSA